MIELFRSGGVIMWPLMAVALGIAWIAVRTALRLSGRAPAEEVRRGLHAILFWAVMSVALGVLGTTGGLVQMAQAVALAGEIEATLVWGGVAVSLVPLIVGLVISLCAALAWFAFRQWSVRRLERTAPGV